MSSHGLQLVSNIVFAKILGSSSDAIGASPPVDGLADVKFVEVKIPMWSGQCIQPYYLRIVPKVTLEVSWCVYDVESVLVVVVGSLAVQHYFQDILQRVVVEFLDSQYQPLSQ
ncbi:hypothetical protein TNCV_1544701 [Trichonephila clavipes]|nr:hypothetical protein TNCV_1544701 [Trichonephila clavipes]